MNAIIIIIVTRLFGVIYRLKRKARGYLQLKQQQLVCEGVRVGPGAWYYFCDAGRQLCAQRS